MTRRLSFLGVALALLLASRPVEAQVLTSGPLANPGDVVSVSFVNVSSALFQLTGTWSGLAVAQGSIDGGTTWWPISVEDQMTGLAVQGMTANGFWAVQNSGFTAIRVLALTWTSGVGTITITRGFQANASVPVLTTSAPSVGAFFAAPVPSVPNASPLLLPCNPLRRINCR